MRPHPNLLLVITCQRHGSSTLCHKLSSHVNTINGGELFRKSSWLKIRKRASVRDATAYIQEAFENHENKHRIINNKPSYFVLKIFQNDINLDILFNTEYPKHIIFLKRNLHDAYASWKRAVTTGNWGTTPSQQANNTHKGYTLEKHEIMSYNDYRIDKIKWFRRAYVSVLENSLPFSVYYFDEIVSDHFKQIVPKIFRKSIHA